MAARSAFGRRQRRTVEVAVLFRPQYRYLGQGGAVSGGAAVTEFEGSGLQVFAYAGVGGAAAAGTAPHSRTRARIGQGGASSGGAAVTSYSPAGANVFAYAGSGGASSGGSAESTDTYCKIFWCTLEVPAS